MKNKALTIIATSLLLMTNAANATDLNKDMDVSATIVSECTLSAGNATLAFGNYTGANTNAVEIESSDIVLTCNGTPSYKLYSTTIDTDRKMVGTNLSGELEYSLFTATGSATPLGSNSAGTDDTVSGNILGVTAGGATATLSIFGSIDVGQYLPTDTYTQTIPLVLEYL
jgi:spore coat protein U-like protein